MTAEFEDERWRYVLLPVSLATYAYRDKTYQLVVNGQTGAVAGYKSVDWLRVWLVIGAILMPGILGGLIGLLTLPLGVGVAILPIAFVLFCRADRDHRHRPPRDGQHIRLVRPGVPSPHSKTHIPSAAQD